jgi:hypothetical protein
MTALIIDALAGIVALARDLISDDGAANSTNSRPDRASDSRASHTANGSATQGAATLGFSRR